MMSLPELKPDMTNYTVVEHLSTAIVTLDSKLVLTSANPAAEMLFELSSKRMLGQGLFALLGDNPELENTLRETLASHHPITARGVMLTLPTDRHVTVDYTVTPLDIQNSDHALVLELTQVDRLLRMVRDEKMLRHQTTNRAVIRGLAHEIKNPLGGIRGAAQLLERELSEPDLTEYTDVIIQEADRLRNLVDRMFGPNQPLNLQPVNIHDVLEYVRRLTLAEIHKGIKITRDFDPSLPELMVDRDQLIQAVLNVVRNATEAMERQGEITLKTRIERQFTLAQARHRLAVRLDIMDNGAGIPSDIVDNIFYPMVTGRAEGTGLGLSITQDIIIKHGGLIECQSQPDRTVFTIFLPLEQKHDH
ncbi:MAG: two-component system sensor histidine kinase NtrB [Gammaproteobacteria bacterium]|nr:MAG: two-component system sensor histidine kinase NtrB [Gammaproteobacteria bacterium]